MAGASPACDRCGGTEVEVERIQLGLWVSSYCPSCGRQAITLAPGAWRWRLLLAILYGLVGLPIMVAMSLMLLGDWLDCGESCLGVGLIVLGATTLCFWYIAGLAWGWPVGLVGPAGGILIAPVPAYAACAVFLVGYQCGAAFGYWVAAVAGIVAYPVGLLARWAFVRPEPWVGLLLGGCLLALGGVVIVTTAQKSDYYATPSTGLMLAPSMVLLGAGTLAVSAWFRVRGSRSTGADTLSG